jgi:hypothetical protein
MGYLKTLLEHIATRTNRLILDVLNELMTMGAFRLKRNQGAMLARGCLGVGVGVFTDY